MNENTNHNGIKLLLVYINENLGAGRKPPFTDGELAKLNDYKDKQIAEGKPLGSIELIPVIVSVG